MKEDDNIIKYLRELFISCFIFLTSKIAFIIVSGDTHYFKEDTYPMAVYARSVSLLVYATVVYARSI